MSVVLPALHFGVGVANNLQGVSWRQYLLLLDVAPADQALLSGVVAALPWNLKLFVAFTSDVLPICGFRRLPYLLAGLCLQGGAWLLLWAVGTSATLALLSLQQFFAMFGQLLVGVMCDTYIVENVKAESGVSVGRLQVNCNLWFAAGGLAGTLLSGMLPQYCVLTYTQMFALTGCSKLVLTSSLFFLREKRFGATAAGTAPVGAAPVGAAPVGIAPVSTAPEGTAPDGTAAEGAPPDGGASATHSRPSVSTAAAASEGGALASSSGAAPPLASPMASPTAAHRREAIAEIDAEVEVEVEAEVEIEVEVKAEAEGGGSGESGGEVEGAGECVGKGTADEKCGSEDSSHVPAAPAKSALCARCASTAAGVWKAMQSLRVVRPLVFIFLFAAAPNANDAFNSYLLQRTPICEWDVAAAACTVAGNASSSDGEAPQRSCAAGAPSNSSAAAEWQGLCESFGTQGACDAQLGGLGFSDSAFSYIGLLGSVGSVLGNALFKLFFNQSAWHICFATTVIVAAAASALQLMLMFRDAEGLTFSERAHLPNLLFALGDDIICASANQLLAMPILVLMARLCPEGGEGTVYALVTSVQMVGSTVGGILSKLATAGFELTNSDFHRLWELTLLTSCTRLSAIFFLPLVPNSLDLDPAHERRSRTAGLLVAALFVGGLLWAIEQILVSLL